MAEYVQKCECLRYCAAFYKDRQQPVIAFSGDCQVTAAWVRQYNVCEVACALCGVVTQGVREMSLSCTESIFFAVAYSVVFYVKADKAQRLVLITDP